MRPMLVLVKLWLAILTVGRDLVDDIILQPHSACHATLGATEPAYIRNAQLCSAMYTHTIHGPEVYVTRR